MSDTPPPPTPPRFPLLTAAVSLGLLFLFLGLMWLAAREPNPLDAPPPADAKVEPKLDEVNKRNRDALDGVGARMSREAAHGKLVTALNGPNDKLPFPIPEPAPPTSTDGDKKDGKEKAP
jgi:hypothetical protein